MAEAPEALADPPPGPLRQQARTYARTHAMHTSPGAAGFPGSQVTWARRGKPRESSPPGA